MCSEGGCLRFETQHTKKPTRQGSRQINRRLGSLVLQDARFRCFEFFVHHVPDALRRAALKHRLRLLQGRHDGILVVFVNMAARHDHAFISTLRRQIHSKSRYETETTWNDPPPTLCSAWTCRRPSPSKTGDFSLASAKMHIRIVSSAGRWPVFSKLGVPFHRLNERRSSLCFSKDP